MGSARCRRGRRRRVVASGGGHPSCRRSRLRDVPRCVQRALPLRPDRPRIRAGTDPALAARGRRAARPLPRSARRAPHVAPLCGLGDRVVPRSAQLRRRGGASHRRHRAPVPGIRDRDARAVVRLGLRDRVRRLVVARRAGAPVTDAARLRARRVGRRSPRARAAGQSGAARAGGDPAAREGPLADTARVVGGLPPRRCRAPRCAGPSTTASATGTTRSRAVGTRACRSSGPS